MLRHRRRRRRAARALHKAAAAEGALVELVAPHIGGVVTSDGELLPAHQKIDGGPSVLYDAVALLASAEGAALLAADPTAKDFVTDAHAHAKFIAYNPARRRAAGGGRGRRPTRRRLPRTRPARRDTTFLERCRDVRHWARTPTVNQT